MNRKLDIETRLDRSLANQVKAPTLGRKFDASVWARIEAEAQAATNPVSAKPQSSASVHWLLISNAIGVSVAVLLVVVFGIKSLAGVSLNVPVPAMEVSAATSEQILGIAGPVITVLALGFGLMFTRLGRWLRAELT